jgi:hypothetical protein
MSDYAVIRGLTAGLQSILRKAITDNASDPQLHNVPIDLRSPKQMREDKNALGVSLWLYQVTRDPDLLNCPPQRVSAYESRYQPMPVYLHYLVTPIRDNGEDEQVLLGRILQVFNDHSRLRPSDFLDPLRDENEEYCITFEAHSLEDLTRIWNALQEPYRLSVSYVAQVARIDSDHENVKSAPVMVRDLNYAQIVNS